MATTLVYGEQITVLCELGFPAEPFTLDDAGLGVLDSNYLDGTLLGTDVSEYIMELSITRGRSDEFESFRAGTMSMRLSDNDRRFDPLNTSSPFYDPITGKSGVTPRRKVTVQSGGVSIFVGRITDIAVNYDYQLSTVTITAADDFVLLANAATDLLLTPRATIWCACVVSARPTRNLLPCYTRHRYRHSDTRRIRYHTEHERSGLSAAHRRVRAGSVLHRRQRRSHIHRSSHCIIRIDLSIIH
jgi:hypothetical protein